MFEHFETFITSQVTFTKEELNLMRALSTEKKLRRRQLLLHEGEICQTKTFVCKGLLRCYRTKDDGTENIMRFAPENYWMMDPQSYNSQTPSKYTIEALEDSDVIIWPRESVNEMFAAIPAFRSYSERLRNNSFGESQDRVLMSISNTAEEKYHEFVNSFPDIFGRVPLHMVASYLGVSRETLSRIRRQSFIEKRNF